MTNVGVIGLGMMGGVHLGVYAARDDANVVAVADSDPKRLSGQSQATGNIEGMEQGGIDFSTVKQYSEGLELISDPDVEAVDVCVPTPLHASLGRAAIEAGKHLLVEKPLARTSAEARELASLAKQSEKIAMPAMCMRFWPGWTWLKEAVDEGRYGRPLAATFRRLAPHPGGAFYNSGQQCGGAILDLHIHDLDFIQHCFGTPTSVRSHGYSKITNAIDHAVTFCNYKGDQSRPPLVMAEGGWAMAGGMSFQMQYTVNFERATAVFDVNADPQLTLYETGQKPRPIELPPGMGYQYMIQTFLQCVAEGRPPGVVTMDEAARSVELVEAAVRSIERDEATPVE